MDVRRSVMNEKKAAGNIFACESRLVLRKTGTKTNRAVADWTLNSDYRVDTKETTDFGDVYS